jgi:hypothetical protein
VLGVEDAPDGRLILTVESDQVQTGCSSCGRRTLHAWRAQLLAYFDTYGVSNGALKPST